MFCQNCGRQIPEESKFCPHCGQQATPAQTQETPQQAQPIQQETQPIQQQAPYQQPLNQPAPYQQPVQQPYQQPLKKKKKTGCLIGIIIAVVLVAVLIILLIIGGGSCSITSARLTETAMASEVDADTQQAVSKTDEFSPDAPVIYATALLNNAPEDTLITAKWRYVTEDIDIASVDLESTETSQYISFSLSAPDNGFPVGDYEVELYIDGTLEETLKFTVK